MRKITIIALAALALVSCHHRTHPNRTEQVSVRVETVAAKEIYSSNGYVGTVEASRSATITAPFPGTIEKLNVKEGHRIVSGAAVATVASESVRSAYDIADATLKQAVDAHERMEKMRAAGGGALTEVQIMDIETSLAKARASYNAAAKAMEDCTVLSPLSGVVSEVHVLEGASVPVMAPLATVMDLKDLQIRFPVPEKELAQRKVGETLTIDIPALEKEITATLTVKGVSASPLSHSYDCTAGKLSDAAGLMPGMVCKVNAGGTDGKAITVPAKCLMTDMDGKYIWCVSPEGVVEKRRVTTGDFAMDGVIITDGLKEGDEIVTEGARKICTGMKVNILR